MRKLPLLALLLTCTSAQASSARYVSLGELVKSSDTVVLGRAGKAESFWQGTRIYTRIEVAVEQVWAGQTPNTKVIDVITPGGVVGNIGQRVDGAAVLPANQRVVLHLRHDVADEYSPVAMAQGVWHIAAGDDAKISRPSTDRLVVMHGTDAPTLPTTLDALHRAVLEAARAH